MVASGTNITSSASWPYLVVNPANPELRAGTLPNAPYDPSPADGATGVFPNP
jgi:hypothetical protein